MVVNEELLILASCLLRPMSRNSVLDLVYVYKIVFNLIDTDSNKFFSVIGNNSGTRGHAYKLYIDYCGINTRKYFLTV